MTAARRIALMSESDRIGGAETMMFHLGTELRERGHTVHFIGPDDGCGWLGGEFARHGFPAHTYHLKRAVDPTTVSRIAQILRQNRIDLIHSHLWVMAVYGAAAGLLTGIPLVVTMHGDGEQTRYLRRRVSLRWAFRRSQATVAVSYAMHGDLKQSLGRVAHDMHVIHNGVPDRVGDRDQVRNELGIRHDELLVVAIGSYCRRKGHLELLQALHRLPADIPWRAAIAGPDEDAAEDMRRFVADQGLSERAHLLGPRQDVPAILAAADVFAMPSHWEGLPMAMLEAMFARRAIVASDVGGIREAVESEREALLVPPGDILALSHALARVLSDGALRKRLGSAARHQAERRFSVQAMTSAYESLYAIR